MAKQLRFDDRVVLVTGAGQGLGRAHALLFASRGAKVVVNDLGGDRTGGGKSAKAADAVVAEIEQAGGEAVASYDSVEQGDKLVQAALDSYGRLDVVVNNAGILRDVSFAKMTDEDWDLVYRVHVRGAFSVTHAAWPHMREQRYGRIVMTSSAAGIYGNFGQANYSMAKLGLAGFANTLAIEGARRGIHVNTIAPLAGSRLTETVLPKDLVDALRPEYVSPLVVYLCHESCEENGGLFEVGGGFFAKLRWERSAGKVVRLGREIAPELVRDHFGEISGFEQTEHPAEVAASMQPIMANISAGPSKGGNELIDVDEALGYEFPEASFRYDERDVALYALGVGAATDPLDENDLQLVYELHGKGMRVLPTFAVIPAINVIIDMARRGEQAPGMNYGLERILHGEQSTEIKRPLPTSAKLVNRAKIKAIYDKGKNAVVVTEIRSYDADTGEELIVNELTSVVRGAGGWGGDRGPKGEAREPGREPDATAEQRISQNQALLYRLTGDFNPLHADPNMARAMGFERPILHGLCTFGYAARHVINAFCDGDPRYFKSIRVRFADSVFPGETLKTEMWKESDTRIAFRCTVAERDKVVISRAAIELYDEIPKRAAPQKPAAAEPQAEQGYGSRDVFVAIRDHIERHPELVGKVSAIYQFRLTDPDSVWTIDLKRDKGAVAEGGEPKPDCTLELSEADFMGMTSGELDPQQLYFGGKLKISGDVMASQKLTFLQKIDPEQAKAAVARARGAEPAAAAASAAEVTSATVFSAIGAYIGEHPELVDKVGTIYRFELSDPDSVWTLDLKNGQGAVAEGGEPKPDCTLALSEADFMGMTSGELDPQQLYFGGKLKISGDVMASQKLTFLQKIDPEQAKAAMARSGSGGATAPSSSAASEPRAPAIFAKLAEHIAATPSLVEQVGAVLQFEITEPASQWSVDLKQGGGSVEKGQLEADTTLTLEEEHLVGWAAGELDPASMHQRGQLRVDGDISPVRKLGFFKGLMS